MGASQKGKLFRICLPADSWILAFFTIGTEFLILLKISLVVLFVFFHLFCFVLLCFSEAYSEQVQIGASGYVSDRLRGRYMFKFANMSL